jgi:ferritin-like metal-binding protein YciE
MTDGIDALEQMVSRLTADNARLWAEVASHREASHGALARLREEVAVVDKLTAENARLRAAYERVVALRQELVDFMASSHARPSLAIEDVLRKLDRALEG